MQLLLAFTGRLFLMQTVVPGDSRGEIVSRCRCRKKHFWIRGTAPLKDDRTFQDILSVVQEEVSKTRHMTSNEGAGTEECGVL